MLCILSTEKNPYFNLAAEEYLFKNFEEDICFLYVNSPAVVVGKHQNALAEINPQFVNENKVAVIRRLSGGGAVYHDLGNLNFSFHQTVDDTSKISFKSFNEPVVEVLHQMGVNAEISNRNDIFVEGFKVSGHAEHVFRKRILSHGTLLFDVKKEHLSKVLKNQSGSFSGKAIQSVRSKVANIIDFMEQAISLDQFIQKIQNHFLNSNSENKIYELTTSEKEAIQHLVEEKYDTWEWNFAYSPKYRFEKTVENIGVSIFVEKGLMKEVEISGDGMGSEQAKAVQNILLNSSHEIESIVRNLLTINLTTKVYSPLIKCFF